jgi:carbon storage regulator CsrA
MLVLTRKHQEKIRIGENITITILKTKGKAVRVGIEAPAEIPVVRGELAANGRAARPTTGALENANGVAAESEPPTRFGRSRSISNGVAWSAKSRPTNADASPRREPTMEVSLQRVPRASVAQVLPRLAGEAGPLRSMVEQRATVCG